MCAHVKHYAMTSGDRVRTHKNGSFACAAAFDVCVSGRMTVSFAHTHAAIIIISVFAADGSVCAILRVQSVSATVAARRAHERRTLAGRLETQIIHTHTR